MQFTPSAVLASVRQPEYTGENRCIPCTVLNVVIAAVVAGGVTLGLAAVSGPVAAGLVGGGSFVASVGVIYLRGYLVPGTPRITRDYVPDRLLVPFDKDGERSPAESGDLDVETVLRRADAVTECERRDDLCTTDGFHAAWREEMERLHERETGYEDFATLLDIDPDRLSTEEHGDAFVVRIHGRRPWQWESTGAFVADMAGANVLRRRYDDWTTLGLETKRTVLDGLRIFLERCPECDGPVAIGDEVVESCCRSVDVVVLTCQDCDARLLETEQPS